MLTMRLQRLGRKKFPTYRLVVSEKVKDTQGTYLEKLGTYNPHDKASGLNLNEERIKHWVEKGAQSSPTVNNLLVAKGIIKGAKEKSVFLSNKRKGKMSEKEEAAKEEAAKEEAAKEEVAKDDVDQAAGVKETAKDVVEKSQSEEISKAEVKTAALVAEQPVEVVTKPETSKEEAPTVESPQAAESKAESTVTDSKEESKLEEGAPQKIEAKPEQKPAE